jgi:D-beta-D-heptose 7-phosphate kinase/D-beta-D-heptose 1-phosphate adenosyltransferase
MFQSPDRVLDLVRSGFGRRTIIVVGDLMLDRYLWGQVERISPEAPVPVLKLQRESFTAGGAANVARNLAALGLDVRLGGVVGDDPARANLLATLARDGIRTDAVHAAPDRGTTVKTRVIGNHQQMIRVDEEHTTPVTPAAEAAILAQVAAQIGEVSAIVLSDYAKGVLTGSLCTALIALASEHPVPIVIDPKGRDFKRYAGATVITPNRVELALATGAPSLDSDALFAAATALREQLGLQAVLLTLGEEGMTLIEAGAMHQITAVAREVFDVSGAGDTVAAILAAGLAAGLPPLDSAHLANLAAGVVVGKVGTANITANELVAAIHGEGALEQAGKVCDVDAVREQVRAWQSRGEIVVFTNGCFDLLHVGHVTYLEKARRYGHRLVVGLNTDRSVRAIKGPQRPVIPQNDRAHTLAALASVDAVVLFDEETPLELIKALRPDILAKGADYTEEQVVGALEVKAWGGRVVILPLVDAQSTTTILSRLRAQATQPS